MIFLVGFTAQLVRGQSPVRYDEEISKLVRKIQQYPGREKYLDELREYYTKADSANQEAISALKKTGQPGIWYEIYQNYLQMENRQKLVTQLPEKSVRSAGIDIVDYKDDLKESKYKALAYLYAHGERLLQSDEPENARLAYAEFMKAASLDGSSP